MQWRSEFIKTLQLWQTGWWLWCEDGSLWLASSAWHGTRFHVKLRHRVFPNSINRSHDVSAASSMTRNIGNTHLTSLMSVCSQYVTLGRRILAPLATDCIRPSPHLNLQSQSLCVDLRLLVLSTMPAASGYRFPLQGCECPTVRQNYFR